MKKSDINIKRKGEKETMEKEKKQIKISLWTFYVLVAGIVILIGAIIIGGMNVKKKMDSLEQGQASLTNKVVQEEKNGTVETPDKVENVSKNNANETIQDETLEKQDKTGKTKEESLECVTLDDKDVKKCLSYLWMKESFNDNILCSLYYEAKNNSNKLTRNTISNDLILCLAADYTFQDLINKEINIEDVNVFTESEMDKSINAIFGNDIKYKHGNFDNGISLIGNYEITPFKLNYSNAQYILDRDSGLEYINNMPISTTFDKQLVIQKNKQNIYVTSPIAFTKYDGNIDCYRIDYYNDMDIKYFDNSPEWNHNFSFNNLIAHNYIEDVKNEENEALKSELIVNDGLGTIEENMDKLHKIKITFTKDDSNEYHFESFEIID